MIIAIILILLFLGKPKKHARRTRPAATKAEPSNKPIADKLNDLVEAAAYTMSGRKITRCQREYIGIKMFLLLYDDNRFKELFRAFKHGCPVTPPAYIFTEKDHQEASEYYGLFWWNFNKEFQNKITLYKFRRAEVTHVYIWPLDHRHCSSVQNISKPKIYPIDEVPKIPCNDCTEQCGCCYMAAKYKDD